MDSPVAQGRGDPPGPNRATGMERENDERRGMSESRGRISCAL